MNKSPDQTDKHVGSRVRMRRLMLDMSQTSLADALDITFQQVQKYEKGTNRISASRLQQISEFLQVPVPFFFEGLPGADKTTKPIGPTIPRNISAFFATSEGLSLVKAFTKVKRRNLRASIVHLVEGLASNSR